MQPGPAGFGTWLPKLRPTTADDRIKIYGYSVHGHVCHLLMINMGSFFFLPPLLRLIQFPPPPLKGGITVTMEDLQCLDSGHFLNDVIIDFYLK